MSGTGGDDLGTGAFRFVVLSLLAVIAMSSVRACDQVAAVRHDVRLLRMSVDWIADDAREIKRQGYDR